MLVLRNWLRRARPLLLGAALVTGIVACGEELESGAACPILCAGQNLAVFDTTFEAVIFDSTVYGIPGFGTEGSLYLAHRGDTLDVRGVVRFDTIPSTYLSGLVDSAITRVDNAYLALRVNATGTRVRGSVRIDLFDVDTTEADTVKAVVQSLFRPDRLMGGSTFDSAQVKDSLRVTLNNARLLAKVTAKQRLRLGIRITAASGAEIDLGSIEGGATPILRFDPLPEDTANVPLSVFPSSSTPPNDAVVSGDFLDYTIMVAAPPAPAGTVLSVGTAEQAGLPALQHPLAHPRFVDRVACVAAVHSAAEPVDRPERFADDRPGDLGRERGRNRHHPRHVAAGRLRLRLAPGCAWR